MDVTDNPLFLSYKLGQKSELVANYIVHGRAEQTTFEVYSEAQIWTEFISVRLQAKLPFTCNFQNDSVQEASSTLRKQVMKLKFKVLARDSKHFLIQVSVWSSCISLPKN